MGLFHRKKENVIKSYNTENADGAEVWLVSWNARYGTYYNNFRRVAKAFLNDKDAINFEMSLRNAAALLQYTEDLDIRIDKQQ